MDTGRLLFIAKGGDSVQLIDKNGSAVLPGVYRGIHFINTDGRSEYPRNGIAFWQVYTKDGAGLYDLHFREIVPPRYLAAFPEKEGICIYRIAGGGHYEVANASYDGQLLAPFQRTNGVTVASIAMYDQPSQYCGGYLPSPSGLSFRGNRLGEIRIGTDRYGILKSFKPAPDNSGALVWNALVQFDSNGNSTGLYAVADASGRLVLQPQPLPVLNIVWPYVQCREAPGYMLLDTGGSRFAAVPSQVVGWMPSGEGPLLFLAAAEDSNPVQREQSLFAATVTYPDGRPVERFRAFHAMRLPQEGELQTLGVKAAFYATDSLGKEGLMTTDGKVRCPALSFHYDKMEKVWADNSAALFRPRLSFYEGQTLVGAAQSWLFLKGSFRVNVGSSVFSYRHPDGRPVLPSSVLQRGEDLWPLSANLLLKGKPGFYPQIMNRAGEQLLPDQPVKAAYRVAGYPDLVFLTLRDAGGKETSVFFSDSGVFFAD